MLNSTDKNTEHKTGLLNLAGERGNVSKACQVVGTNDSAIDHLERVRDGSALVQCIRMSSQRLA